MITRRRLFIGIGALTTTAGAAKLLPPTPLLAAEPLPGRTGETLTTSGWTTAAAAAAKWDDPWTMANALMQQRNLANRWERPVYVPHDRRAIHADAPLGYYAVLDDNRFVTKVGSYYDIRSDVFAEDVPQFLVARVQKPTLDRYGGIESISTRADGMVVITAWMRQRTQILTPVVPVCSMCGAHAWFERRSQFVGDIVPVRCGCGWTGETEVAR